MSLNKCEYLIVDSNQFQNDKALEYYHVHSY